MKKLVIIFLSGLLVGLLISTILCTSKYNKLFQRYNNTIQLLSLYKNYIDTHSCILIK